MTDIHCHILPAVDDGSEDLSVSLAMARAAARGGTETLVATPHCNIPGAPRDNFAAEELLERFDALREAVAAENIPLEILNGAEIFCTADTPRLLREGRLLTLAGSRYLLTEFYFDERPDTMTEYLERLAAEGVTPVIAHPERYEAVQRRPALAAEWFANGWLLQVNKDSLLGRLGRGAAATADRLLRRGLAHLLASDAHGAGYRHPRMDEVRDCVEDLYSPVYARVLLEENPRRLIENRPMLSPGEAAGD